MSWAGLLSTVFAPELFVLVATLLVVGYEARSGGRRWRAFAVRAVAVGVAWALAFAVYRGGPGLVPGPVPGGEDFFASAGLIAAFAALWIAWRRRGWGALTPAYCRLLIGVSVLHAAVVPLWDVSSHVLYAAVAAGYLSAVDRRFGPLLAVPLGLAWSRVALDAHTVDEAVGGLAVAAAIGAAVVLGGRVTNRAPRPVDDR